MMFLFWLPVLAIGAWLISRSGDFRPRDQGSDALEILRQRYARGEISQEEYQQIKRDLLG